MALLADSFESAFFNSDEEPMRVLVFGEYSGRVRDAFKARGHQAMSCDLLPTDVPGLHYEGDGMKILDGWMPVAYTAQCDPDGDGWCHQCDCDPNDCLCIGPTEDRIEYKEIDGEMFGRPKEHPHWDLMVCHPTCTYLTCSAEWAYKEGPYHQEVEEGTLVGAERVQAREEAINFCIRLMDAPIKKIALENPVGVLSKRMAEPTQYIQPYEYGDDASKKTCLWLKGLKPLVPTHFIPPRLAPTANGKGYAFRWGNQTDSGQNKETPGEDRWKIRSTTWMGWANAMGDQWG